MITIFLKDPEVESDDLNDKDFYEKLETEVINF